MTYEPIHSAQAQSVRVTKKYILVLLVTIVATLQEVRINVYLSLIPNQVLMFWAIGQHIAIWIVLQGFDWNPIH